MTKVKDKYRDAADKKAWALAEKFQRFVFEQESEIDGLDGGTWSTHIDGRGYRIHVYGTMTVMDDGGDGVYMNVNVQRFKTLASDVKRGDECPRLGPKSVNRGCEDDNVEES